MKNKAPAVLCLDVFLICFLWNLFGHVVFFCIFLLRVFFMWWKYNLVLPVLSLLVLNNVRSAVSLSYGFAETILCGNYETGGAQQEM